jgi:hypothetical protein
MTFCSAAVKNLEFTEATPISCISLCRTAHVVQMRSEKLRNCDQKHWSRSEIFWNCDQKHCILFSRAAKILEVWPSTAFCSAVQRNLFEL